jgi:hypothetical protein
MSSINQLTTSAIQLASHQNGTVLRTLGNRKNVTFGLDRERLYIITSSGKKYWITESQIRSVAGRFRSLGVSTERYGKPIREVTSEYTDPKWEERPNRITAPYIAALIKASQENE